MRKADESTLSAHTAASLAPAKINLALHVTGQRSDGYHLLETLCVFARFGDRLTVENAAQDSFEISGPYAGGLSSISDNLVVRARDLLRSEFPCHSTGPVAIRLEKNLPIAAGLGGGSSDAAAGMRLLNVLWRLGTPPDDMAEVGLSLGADVPMCLSQLPLIARGIGEQLEAVRTFPALAMVLVNPGVLVPTAAIFTGLSNKNNPPLPPLPETISRQALTGWLRATRNDLQAPAIAHAPEIAGAIGLLENAGAKLARMTGSGATVFGIFDSFAAAGEAAKAVAVQRPGWFVKAVETGGSRAV